MKLAPAAGHPLPRRHLLALGVGGLAALPLQGCWALMVKGGPRKNPRSDEIMWGFVVLDLLVGAWVLIGYIPVFPIGLVIDFATGAIYRPLADGTRRRRHDPDLDDIEQEMEDEARGSPAGQEAVLVDLCPQAEDLLHELEPGHLLRWARAFRGHVEVCPSCAAALVQTGVPLRVPDHLVGRGELVLHELEAVPAALPELSAEELARLADATAETLAVLAEAG